MHSFSDSANVIDVVYGFNVGGGRVGTAVQIVANVNGNADQINVQIYDHVGSTWDNVGIISGAGGADLFVSIEPALFQRHSGTGAELGKVYVRFSTVTTTPSILEVDQCVVSAVNIGQSVGYANGSIWVDTVNGSGGTESFVNGTADNPVCQNINVPEY